MNTSVQGYSNDFQLKYLSETVPPCENHVFEKNHKHDSLVTNGIKDFSFEGNNSSAPSDDFSSSSAEGESLKEENDYLNATLKFISDMLMEEEEEDLSNNPDMLRDSLALQATEKSLHDALNNNSDDHDQFTRTCSSDTTNLFDSSCTEHFESLFISSDAHNPMSPFWVVSNSSRSDTQFDSLNYEFLDHDDDSEPIIAKATTTSEKEINEKGGSREKKNRCREDDGDQEQRSNKQLADAFGQTEPLEMLNSTLLSDHPMRTCGETEKRQSEKKSRYLKEGTKRGRPRGGGKNQGAKVKEFVDLGSLLMQCAQAVASFDSRTVMDLLQRIRKVSSPKGDASERLAHCFANAFEARLGGTGSTSYAEFNLNKLSVVDILNSYKMFITVCPFKNMSHLLANETIEKLATGANTLHIIDFGILFGYQWPCLIQALSRRPGGPPRLRLTGIEKPQPGFRPEERVVNTGRRLAKFCERFGVPFEYNAIAQSWATIRLEDLKIGNNELLVVNSLYRLHNELEETETAIISPRDVVMNLIRSINPDLFIHGVISGTYNTPFFTARFREALFHFSSMFDMFDATVPRDDQDRLLFEEQNLGKDVMNIIACEGTERIERPDTYKQWQARSLKAGFRQIPFDPKIISYMRSKVKTDYHRDFSVDEDGQWVLHGWKGRVNRAISCWKPDHVSS